MVYACIIKLQIQVQQNTATGDNYNNCTYINVSTSTVAAAQNLELTSSSTTLLTSASDIACLDLALCSFLA